MAERCAGTGNCVYVHLEESVDVQEVAVDLRKHAPTVLMMVCQNREVAKEMCNLLSKPAIAGVETKKDKEKGTEKEKVEQTEKEMYCRIWDTILIAARKGYRFWTANK